MIEDIEIRAQRAPWNRGVEINASGCDRAVRKVFTAEANWQEIPDGSMAESPTFKLSIEQAQTLMDDLWNCGLRPTEGAGSAGAMRAVEKHLEDMRKIAFLRLGMNEKSEPL